LAGSPGFHPRQKEVKKMADPITATIERGAVAIRLDAKLLADLLVGAIAVATNGHVTRPTPRPKASAKPKVGSKAWTPAQRRKFRETMRAKRNGAPSEPQALP
jgi:uncharacterized membrane protein